MHSTKWWLCHNFNNKAIQMQQCRYIHYVGRCPNVTGQHRFLKSVLFTSIMRKKREHHPLDTQNRYWLRPGVRTIVVILPSYRIYINITDLSRKCHRSFFSEVSARDIVALRSPYNLQPCIGVFAFTSIRDAYIVVKHNIYIYISHLCGAVDCHRKHRDDTGRGKHNTM